MRSWKSLRLASFLVYAALAFGLCRVSAVPIAAQVAPGIGRFSTSSSTVKSTAEKNARAKEKQAKAAEKAAIKIANIRFQHDPKSKGDAITQAGNAYVDTLKRLDKEKADAEVAAITASLNGGLSPGVVASLQPSPWNGVPDVTFSRTAVIESSVINDKSQPETITIHNTGTSEYKVGSATIAGPGALAFTVTGCTPNLISSTGGDCVLNITYGPKAASGADFADLVVTLVDLNPPAGATAPVIPSYTAHLTGYPAATCGDTAGYAAFQSHLLVPLTHHDVDDTTINCYYNTSSNLAFATLVGYQYNPSGSANTVSSDLISFQFTGGIQLALAGTASTGSCPTTTTGAAGSTSATASSCGSATSGGATATTTPTLEQDIQTLEQGGDLALKATYPLLNWRGNRIQALSFATPRVGFTINGLSATSTTTNATDINFNLSNESYGQIDAIPSHTGGDAPASIFVDYRWGLEHVSDAYALASSLPKSNFLLQQIEAGIVIGGSIKVSAERYVGPSQIYVDSTGKAASSNSFGNWQLRVQITPSSLAVK